MGTAGARRWTFSLPMRACFYLILALATAVIIFVLIGIVTGSSAILGKGSRTSWSFAVAFFAAQAFSIWRIGPRNFVEARQEGLFVRNPLRDRLIPWSSITAIAPGYSGLRVHLSEGTTVTVWAVQTTNLARVFRSGGRATRIAQQIAETADARGAQIAA